MPGDLITADWQMQLDTWTGGGADDDWVNIPPGWSDPTGGVTVERTAPLSFSDGVAVGYETDGPIVFTASLATAGHLDAADAMDALSDLRLTWRASGITDKELWMQVPGLGLCYLLGRPRAPQVSLTLAPHGHIAVMVTFLGRDGVLYLDES